MTDKLIFQQQKAAILALIQGKQHSYHNFPIKGVGIQSLHMQKISMMERATDLVYSPTVRADLGSKIVEGPQSYFYESRKKYKLMGPSGLFEH